jgi:hypothetical protein
MPASDYDARALALPLDDEETGQTPIWSRRTQSATFRRNPSHQSQQSTWRQRAMDKYDTLSRRVLDQYNKLSPLQKVLFFAANLMLAIGGILFLVYNERIFGALLPVAKKWRDVTAGWLILWVLIFIVSFPPLIGYSSLLTIAGFVYGFPNGYDLCFTHNMQSDIRPVGSSPQQRQSPAAQHPSSSRAPSSNPWCTAL